MAGKRVALSFTDAEMARLHKWNNTGLPLATAMKWLVLDAVRIMSGELVTTPIGSNTLSHGSGKLPVVVTTPSYTRAGTDSGKKKEEKRRSGRGSVRGEQVTLDGTVPPPFTEPVVIRIIEHLNDTCEMDFLVRDQITRKLILKRLADGHRLEDFKLVHEWADMNWSAEKQNGEYWRSIMVVPSKLYGDRFGEHLGVARSWKKQQAKEEQQGAWSPPEDQIHYPGKF